MQLTDILVLYETHYLPRRYRVCGSNTVSTVEYEGRDFDDPDSNEFGILSTPTPKFKVTWICPVNCMHVFVCPTLMLNPLNVHIFIARVIHIIRKSFRSERKHGVTLVGFDVQHRCHTLYSIQGSS